MGFFSQLEQFERKLTRWYVRWGRWVWRILIAVPVLVVLWNLGQAVWGGPRGGVILVIHSEIDRPIRGFSVNGVAGADASANGGGSTTCCGDVSGETAEVIWTVDYSLAQYKAGIRTEVHHKTLPLPKREWGEDFLHVHFLPGNKVLLGWSKDLSSPYDEHRQMNTEIRAECQSDKPDVVAVMHEWRNMKESQTYSSCEQWKKVEESLDKARQVGLTKPLDQKIYAFNYLNGKKAYLESVEFQAVLEKVKRNEMSLSDLGQE